MPSFIHQTLSSQSPAIPSEANGAPLSMRFLVNDSLGHTQSHLERAISGSPDATPITRAALDAPGSTVEEEWGIYPYLMAAIFAVLGIFPIAIIILRDRRRIPSALPGITSEALPVAGSTH
ncbi:hypothetical protein K2X89_17690 [Myxococcota bacterium]|nr:hypothetical protein [Myxococcota bacterium]